MSIIAIQSPEGASKQLLCLVQIVILPSSVVQTQTCVSCQSFSSSVEMLHRFKEVCLWGGEGKIGLGGGGRKNCAVGRGEGEGKIALVQVQELFELFELFSQQIFSLEFDSEIHS